MLSATQDKILIVDDDLGTALLEQRCLERRGYATVKAATAAEALEALREGDVKLIVLDYRLSESSTGLDFCEQLKCSGCSAPIVIVTGFSQESTAIEALRAGVRDYVNKSADYLEYLPESVDRVLQQVGVERKLAESEARLAAIINCSQDAIVAVDEQQNITLFNPAAEDIFGCHVTQALGTSIRSLIPAELAWAPTWQATQLASLTAVGARVPHVQVTGIHMDGTSVPLEVTVSHVAACGRTFSTLIIRNITRRKQAEEALRQRDDQLRQAQKMEAIGTLAGGIAHEFNNLLQAIHGYVTFARNALSPDEQPRQDLDQALKAIDQAAGLTRQLLGFARRESLQFADVELNRFVEEFVKMLRRLIDPRITFALDLSAPGGTMHADRGQLQQVLMNLCLNARDAMPDGGTLTIGTERRQVAADAIPNRLDLQPGNYLLLTVRDTGCGISADIRDHLFEPFFTTKETGKGTGLGLAMVYGIVKQHQGAIHVRSEPEQGSTFEIYLPTA
jgi:PAS domain S-box-containing protein